MNIRIGTKIQPDVLNLKSAKRSYQLPPSILTHLPWVEFDNNSQSVLLQDKSIGAAFELSLVAGEAKPDNCLQHTINSNA